MARADVFALPSWDEAFGLVYTEAMSQGTPVVACSGRGPRGLHRGRRQRLPGRRTATSARWPVHRTRCSTTRRRASGGRRGRAMPPPLALTLGAQRQRRSRATGRTTRGPSRRRPSKGLSDGLRPFLGCARAPRRRSSCRSRSPTASASSATSGAPASRCSPSTPTRAPSACARGYAAGHGLPRPAEDEEAFVLFLEDLGRRLPRRRVVFPTHDEYIWPLSRHAERLEPWYLIPFSRWET